MGESRSTTSSSPPIIRQKPRSKPQTPPLVPTSTWWMPFSRELGGVADVVDVVRVAAVDDRVAGLEHLGERRDRLSRDVAGRHHHPGGARLLELRRELLERRRAGRRRPPRAPSRRPGGRRSRRSGARPSCSRRTIPPPIRPSPTIPSCMGVSVGMRLAPSFEDELLDRVREAVVLVRRGDAGGPRAAPRDVRSPSRWRGPSGRTSARRSACRRWSRSRPRRARTARRGT